MLRVLSSYLQCPCLSPTPSFLFVAVNAWHIVLIHVYWMGKYLEPWGRWGSQDLCLFLTLTPQPCPHSSCLSTACGPGVSAPAPQEPSCQLSSEDFPKHTTSIRKCKAAVLCLNGSSLCPFPLLFLLDIQIFLILSQNSSPACLLHKAFPTTPAH